MEIVVMSKRGAAFVRTGVETEAPSLRRWTGRMSDRFVVVVLPVLTRDLSKELVRGGGLLGSTLGPCKQSAGREIVKANSSILRQMKTTESIINCCRQTLSL